MNAHIIIIGDEILLGRVTDTNSGTIARTLTATGWTIGHIATVGDDRNAISAAVNEALAAADLVITTGGLGPTRDDITKGVLTDVFGGHLTLHQPTLDNVCRIFEQRGLQMNDLTRSQAMVPDSCRVITNELGTAPIMWFERADGKVLVAMPGVPFETRGMLERAVAAEIERRFHPERTTHRGEITAVNISESALAERLAPFEDALPAGCHLAYLPSPGIIVLRLDADGTGKQEFNGLMQALRAATGENYAGDGRLGAAELAVSRLRAHGFRFATAESCTGGNIAHLITQIAGCSDVYAGGIVAYSNDVKTAVLGVSTGTLAECGAVSEETVREMATGALTATGADCAIATSGIAGPGGGSADKPVGTVWMAAATPAGVFTRLYHIAGDRQAVIDAASARALMLLNENL